MLQLLLVLYCGLHGLNRRLSPRIITQLRPLNLLSNHLLLLLLSHCAALRLNLLIILLQLLYEQNLLFSRELRVYLPTRYHTLLLGESTLLLNLRVHLGGGAQPGTLLFSHAFRNT